MPATFVCPGRPGWIRTTLKNLNLNLNLHLHLNSLYCETNMSVCEPGS